MDTIVACATAPGRGGIGIVRLSGPRVIEIAVALVGSLPPPRLAALRPFRGADDEVIDVDSRCIFRHRIPTPESTCWNCTAMAAQC